MALHLVKLCVGVESVEDLQAFVDARMDALRAAGEKPERYHITRMIPRRRDELLDGGSLYWVIKGSVQCRSKLLDIRPFTDEEGISRCKLVLDPRTILTHWQPRRAFQGWRYLKGNEAPADLSSNDEGLTALPPELRIELAELGLI
jgi:hypothetical protein